MVLRQAERDELLKAEKELTRKGDELTGKRRALPWVRVEQEYRFETEEGTKTLAELCAQVVAARRTEIIRSSEERSQIVRTEVEPAILRSQRWTSEQR